LTCCRLRSHFRPWEESRNSICNEVLRRWSVDRICFSHPRRLMHEQQAAYNREPEKSHRPPKFQCPRPIRRYICRQCRTCNTSKVQAPVKCCKSSASLVKEEKVNQNSWPKNSSDAPKESREKSGDDEAVELIFMGHESTPYLREETGDQCPEYD